MPTTNDITSTLSLLYTIIALMDNQGILFFTNQYWLMKLMANPKTVTYNNITIVLIVEVHLNL